MLVTVLALAIQDVQGFKTVNKIKLSPFILEIEGDSLTLKPN
jgi:hypothetical protein